MLSRTRTRALVNRVNLTASVAVTVLGLVILALILFTLLQHGIAAISPRLFTGMTAPPGSANGGLLNAIVGSLLITGLAIIIGTPIGIMAGTYLAEFGIGSPIAAVIRFINDILLSAPSILVGLFIYEVVVVPS